MAFTIKQTHTHKHIRSQDELYDYSTRMRRTSLEVLSDFPSCKGNVPLSYLFDLFLPIKPRQFSIASSYTAYPNEVHLCVAIVRYRTRMSTPRVGLCTSWLQNLTAGMLTSGYLLILSLFLFLLHWYFFVPLFLSVYIYIYAHTGSAIPVWVRSGTIHMPADSTAPMVMVGPGIYIYIY